MAYILRFIAALAACAATSTGAFFLSPYSPMSEYVNEATGRYVWLDPGEAAAVENGSAGPSWQATGYTFHAVFKPSITFTHEAPVCRFYSPVHRSHFFTASAAECEALKRPGGDWIYEKIAFTAVAGGPACDGMKPVYRLYNNRHAEQAADHRYTPDPAVRRQLIDAGRTDEGVAFCTSSWWITPQKSFYVYASRIDAQSACERTAGACVALGQLPPMSTVIPHFLPPSFGVNPAYPAQAASITLAGPLDLWTFLRPDDPSVVRHSFVQAQNTINMGIHVNGADRLATPYASISPMYRVDPSAPVFPWRTVRDRTLYVVMELQVGAVHRRGPGDHAYGGLLLEFVDSASGRSFYVTVQAYGTMPAGDFVGPDAQRGIPIVSTVFRGNPAFGASTAEDYVQCGTDTSICTRTKRFEFRMQRADLAAAVARARTVDPALSTDVSGYSLAQVMQKNETFGEAEVGLSILQIMAQLWYYPPFYPAP